MLFCDSLWVPALPVSHLVTSRNYVLPARHHMVSWCDSEVVCYRKSDILRNLEKINPFPAMMMYYTIAICSLIYVVSQTPWFIARIYQISRCRLMTCWSDASAKYNESFNYFTFRHLLQMELFKSIKFESIDLIYNFKITIKLT